MVVFWTVQSSLPFLSDSLIVQQEYFLTAELLASMYLLTAESFSKSVLPDS